MLMTSTKRLWIQATRSFSAAAKTTRLSESLLRNNNQVLRRTMSSTTTNTKFYILRYEYVPDILEKRGPFRAEHLQNAKDLHEKGKVVMAGALVDPCDAGIFIFKTTNKNEIEEFVQKDPYVKNHLVSSHSIREWMVVIQ
jgi:uncharacterized protein YciI